MDVALICLLNTDLYRYECISQPSSEKLLLAVDGDEHGDPHLGEVRRTRDWTAQMSEKGHLHSLSPRLRELHRRGNVNTVSTAVERWLGHCTHKRSARDPARRKSSVEGEGITKPGS